METTCSETPPPLTSAGSSGWAAWSIGAAAIRATTVPRIMPRPSPTGQGTGSTASTAISSAPPSAIMVMTPMPLTHAAVAVDCAMANVKRKTISADHRTPPPIDDRARLQTTSWASCRRVLRDANCISRPHQASEVVAPAHDIEVHVLAEIEARVLVGAAEAPDVQVEDDQSRTPAADGLQKPDPGRVGAGGDHGDGAARQPANLVPRQRLGQRRAAVGLRYGEIVEDEAVLADRAVRLEDRPLGIVRDQSDLPALTVDLRRHRGRQAHCILDRRFLAFTEVHAAVEVQQDPEVGRQRLFESLRHEPAVPSRERPMDAAEAVSCRVVADAAGLRRVVGPGAEAGRVAHLLRAWREQVGDGPDPWINEDRRALGQLEFLVEETERLAHA